MSNVYFLKFVSIYDTRTSVGLFTCIFAMVAVAHCRKCFRSFTGMLLGRMLRIQRYRK